MGDFDKIKELEKIVIHSIKNNRGLSSPENIVNIGGKNILLKERLLELYKDKDIYDDLEYVYDIYKDLYKVLGFRRKSKVPSYVHPLGVSYGAKNYGLSYDIIKLAIFHDILEDMKKASEMNNKFDFNSFSVDLEKRVGESLYNQIKKITHTKQEISSDIYDVDIIDEKKLESYKEYIKNLFNISRKEDLDVIFTKLVDRLDNTYTFKHLSYEDIFKNIRKNSIILDFTSHYLKNNIDFLEKNEKDFKLLNRIYDKLKSETLKRLNKEYQLNKKDPDNQFDETIQQLSELKHEFDKKYTLMNEFTPVLDNVFKNPEIEIFIKDLYDSYLKNEVNDSFLKNLMNVKKFKNYNLDSIISDIRKETKEAITYLGNLVDKLLVSLYGKNENGEENFVRSYSTRYGRKGKEKEILTWKINSGEEMEKIMFMSIDDYLSSVNRTDLIEEEKGHRKNVFLNPHASYTLKEGIENKFNIKMINVRVKNPYSKADKTIRYLTNADKSTEKINDFLGIKIILDENSTKDDCYKLKKYLITNVLDSNEYKIIEDEDYIKNPKNTGYRSLKIAFKDEKCFEIQILTNSMHVKSKEDGYSKSKFQNGKDNPMFLFLSHLYSSSFV